MNDFEKINTDFATLFREGRAHCSMQETAR